MKFSVAFVVGDTELHDQLCCKFGARSSTVKYICRHCKCPTEHLIDPLYQPSCQLWLPDDYEVPVNISPNHWKSLSHHNVKNSFYNIDFGMNPHNIHLASPGECLHMHQLGNAKRAIECFEHRVLHVPVEGTAFEKQTANRPKAFAEFSNLAFNYGFSLSRQSERCLPRTRFSADILSPTKKNGKDYPAVILCVLVSLLSAQGKSILNESAKIPTQSLKKFVCAFEQILFFNAFFEKCELPIAKVPKLNSVVARFMTLYTKTFSRGGMGNCLIKNHLFFHLQKYVEMFGPPAGWDSSCCEGHHKTDIKAPSKITQRHASTLIKQTCQRKMEQIWLDRARTCNVNFCCAPIIQQNQRKHIAGSTYKLFRVDGNSHMKWDGTHNQLKAHLPKQTIDYCCRAFIPNNNECVEIRCFTEHNCCFDGSSESTKFRSNPSYRSDDGSKCSVWYDWAHFKYHDAITETEKTTPAQILCFVHLTDDQANYADLDGAGPYAVVRSFKKEPSPLPPSKIVTVGELDNHHYVYHCDSIAGPAAVVKNHGDASLHNKFFVVSNSNHWLRCFHSLFDQEDNKNNNNNNFDTG